jgi:hypothetical protein
VQQEHDPCCAMKFSPPLPTMAWLSETVGLRREQPRPWIELPRGVQQYSARGERNASCRDCRDPFILPRVAPLFADFEYP